MDPFNDILGGAAPMGQPPGVPSPQAPSGSPDPFDQWNYPFSVSVNALKQLCTDLRNQGQDVEGNEVDQMAVKLEKLRLKLKQKLQRAAEALQGPQVAQQVASQYAQ